MPIFGKTDRQRERDRDREKYKQNDHISCTVTLMTITVLYNTANVQEGDDLMEMKILYMKHYNSHLEYYVGKTTLIPCH